MKTIGMTGKHHTEETKAKMREARKRLGLLPPSHLGHIHSEETKLKMRKKHKPFSEQTKSRMKGRIPWNKGGGKYSVETRKKMSQSRIGKKPWNKGKEFLAIKGEKNHNWKGGVTPFYRILRRKRLKENGGSHSIHDWETLKAQYNWTCLFCKQQEPDIKLTKDHIIPVSKGGSNNIENIQPLCMPCNSRKHIKIILIENNVG